MSRDQEQLASNLGSSRTTGISEPLERLGYFSSPSRIAVLGPHASVEELVDFAESVGVKRISMSQRLPSVVVHAPSSSDIVLLLYEAEQVDAPKSHSAQPRLLAAASRTEMDRSSTAATHPHLVKQLSRTRNIIVVEYEAHDPARALTTQLWVKGGKGPHALKLASRRNNVDRLLTWDEYIRAARATKAVEVQSFDELMNFADDLHRFIRNHAKVAENEKPLLVSGTLIALRNESFKTRFHSFEPLRLQGEWMNAIEHELGKAGLPVDKLATVKQAYSGIAAHPELRSPTKTHPKGVLYQLVADLNEKVRPFVEYYSDFDVIGEFYGEFLKYTGGDKKALGIVLTPRHIAELFCHIAGVTKDSRVLDICTGTGGFLVMAMHQMLAETNDSDTRRRIKETGLVGVEQQPNMFTLAASNMHLRGDGKASLYQGSCFSDDITTAVRAHRCDVGMLNPPYSQREDDLHELRYVKHMLDCLAPGGVGIAIVPMSCALSANSLRGEILNTHTLEAVMSMPDELFYPVSVVTCIMVFTAHLPHAESGKATWFGYWKEDGFQKTKAKGRIDSEHVWPARRKAWIDAYRSRDVIPGHSVIRHVTKDDDWCAEAYMDTDYSQIDEATYVAIARDYIVYQLTNRFLEE